MTNESRFDAPLSAGHVDLSVGEDKLLDALRAAHPYGDGEVVRVASLSVEDRAQRKSPGLTLDLEAFSKYELRSLGPCVLVKLPGETGLRPYQLDEVPE